MADFFVGIFLSFFAIYGLVQTIVNVFSYIGDRKVFKNQTVYTLVAVKNQEEKIEGIVNSLMLKKLKEDTGAYNNKIAVVDMGSTDKTKDILEILKVDKPSLFSYTKSEFLEEMEKNFI